MDDKQKQKAAAAAVVAAVITASGAAVDANFDNPADLLQQTTVEPKVQHIDWNPDQDGSQTVQDDEKSKKAEEKKGSPIREWVLSLPLAVRAIVVLPIWFVGHLACMGASLLFAGLAPVWQWVLTFAIMTLIIGGAFALSAKAMFPDLPWGKIINRHTIKGILIASVLAFAANLVLGMFWPAYAQFKNIVTGGLTIVAIGSIVAWFARREHRRRLKEAAKAAEEISEPEPSDELVYSSLGQTFKIKDPHGEE